MSDWPQLEARLVESARRRSRWRMPRLLLAPLVVSLAVAAVVLLAGRSPQRAVIPPDERPVATHTPAATDPLEHDYGVFRRPASSADALPISAKGREGLLGACGTDAVGPMCLRVDTARLAFRDGNLRFYLVQGKRRSDLCYVGFIGKRGGGAGCTTADDQRLAKPMGSYGPPRNGKPAGGMTVFPDGVQRVAYTFADGTTAVRTVKDNFAYVTSPAAITSLAWVVDGVRYTQQVADPDPNDRAAAQSCPKLDPLPASPEPAATQAAQDRRRAASDSSAGDHGPSASARRPRRTSATSAPKPAGTGSRSTRWSSISRSSITPTAHSWSASRAARRSSGPSCGEA